VPVRVLVADDDPIPRRVVEASLRRAGYEPVVAVDGVEALHILSAPDCPRLVVLDWKMPRLDGLGVCRAIRSSRQEPYVYVLLLTANDREEEIVEGLDAGADDYVTKPCNFGELQARLRAAVRILKLQDQLVAAREASREQAMRDPLTGLFNRGAVLDALQRECSRTDRTRGTFGVIMLDVDHFKTINDTHGHLVGDGVLREVAARLRASLRTYDSIGRYGGEEFLVIAPECSAPAAQELAERLRRCVCDTPIVFSGRTLTVSISLGVACGAGSPARDQLLRGADEALYVAKAGGRNRLEVDPASVVVRIVPPKDATAHRAKDLEATVVDVDRGAAATVPKPAVEPSAHKRQPLPQHRHQ
jgi:two-component system, cell cycle response regulator